jgi:hypothetical protein
MIDFDSKMAQTAMDRRLELSTDLPCPWIKIYVEIPYAKVWTDVRIAMQHRTHMHDTSDRRLWSLQQQKQQHNRVTSKGHWSSKIIFLLRVMARTSILLLALMANLVTNFSSAFAPSPAFLGVSCTSFQHVLKYTNDTPSCYYYYSSKKSKAKDSAGCRVIFLAKERAGSWHTTLVSRSFFLIPNFSFSFFCFAHNSEPGKYTNISPRGGTD